MQLRGMRALFHGMECVKTLLCNLRTMWEYDLHFFRIKVKHFKVIGGTVHGIQTQGGGWLKSICILSKRTEITFILQDCLILLGT